MEPITNIQPTGDKQAGSSPIRAFFEQMHPKGGVSKKMVAVFYQNLMKQFNVIMQDAMKAAKRGSEDLKKAENITNT